MFKIANYYRDSETAQILTIIALFIVIVSSLAFLIGLMTGWPFGQTFDIAFRSISIFLLIAGFVWMAVSRLGAGPLLLDTGAVYPGRGWFIAGVLGYLIVLSLDFDFGNLLRSLTSQANTLLLVIYFAVLALGRLQVREQGIWLYTVLLPWNKIESYTLSDRVFYFQVNGLWLWMRKTYVVPEAHVEAFETYLLEHNVPENTAGSVVPA